MENLIFIYNQSPDNGRYERSIIIRSDRGEKYYETCFLKLFFSEGNFPFKNLLPKEAILEKYYV